MNSDSDERYCASVLCDENEGEKSLGTKRCAGCRKAWYCSTACQNADWPYHIFDCKAGQPISTVYYLARDMARDMIPVHHQTRVDYGFEKVERMIGGNAQNMLCGLYQGLLHHLEVPRKELRKWQKEGRLVEAIKATYEARVPPENRGRYYPWFLQHQYVLDGMPVDEEMEIQQTEGQVEAMLRRGWAYAGGSSSDAPETIRSSMDALPKHKKSCFQLCSMLLTGTHPPPFTELWLSFGYVSRDNELDHSRKYQELIAHCNFDEFCQAYETSSIPTLFDRYDIRFLVDEMCDRHHRFLDVMSGSPNAFKSVWALKQYIDQLDAADPRSPPTPARSVQWDYGYANCKNAEEVKLLDKLYTQLLTEKARDVDPLALHAACLKGELLEFAKQSVTLAPWTAKYTRLLKNNYPLPISDV